MRLYAIKNNISLHMKNIFESGEREENSTVKNFLTVQKEGTRNAQYSKRSNSLHFPK